MKRRDFLNASVKSGATVTLSSLLFQLQGCSLQDKKSIRDQHQLIDDPKEICNLPKDFSYKVISTMGETMSDGLKVSDYHDGMGCFAGPDGGVILVRNHEIRTGITYNPERDKPSPLPEFAYDSKASGGTVTIYLDKDLNLIKHYQSLTGTILNCAGGTTPWGTWISCEEAGDEGWFMGKRHGYVFEVDPTKPIQKAEPLKAMGRFNHEAIAVDPETGIVYLTEDEKTGCFYRFIPKVKDQLNQGGELQALKFVDPSIKHTTFDGLSLNKSYACEWVTVDEPDPEEDNIRFRAQAKGAAVFVRGEGLSIDQDGIYFTCTEGGQANKGQVFCYKPNSDNLTGNIELLYECSENTILAMPDNLTVSPWGDLIICEDNGHKEQFIVGLTKDGNSYVIASNRQSEWAGVCFSPDGKTMFANIHKQPGMTLAIQGDWSQLHT